MGIPNSGHFNFESIHFQLPMLSRVVIVMRIEKTSSENESFRRMPADNADGVKGW